MPHERRRHVRKVVDLPATYQLEGKEPVTAHVTDMSPGGAFVELSEPVDFGAKMELWIDFPTGKSIEVGAVVRWTKEGGAGVQFGSLSASETFVITEFLADLDGA